MDRTMAETLPEPTDRPWQDLPTISDVELWVLEHDQELQRYVDRNRSAGHGICLTLEAGGEMYLHTNGDGDIVLDLGADAAWVAPVIAAATHVPTPAGLVWLLPGDVLVQLILGLNMLVASSRIVLNHRFRTSR